MKERRNAWKGPIGKLQSGRTKDSCEDCSCGSSPSNAISANGRAREFFEERETDSGGGSAPTLRKLLECPYLGIACLVAVLLWTIVVVVIKSPGGYFEPQKAADYGPIWCEANYTRVECELCPDNLKIYQIHQGGPHKGFMYGMMRRIKYNFYIHWNFFITFSKMRNFSRAYFSLLTFDEGKIDAISLKFFLESKTADEMVGYAFFNRSKFKPTADPGEASGLLKIIETHASHIAARSPREWKYFTPIEKKFFFRIDRGPHGGLLRAGACPDCKIPVFKHTIPSKGGYERPSVTQVFSVSWDMDSDFDYSLHFMKRCYVTDGTYQYCPVPDTSALKRCSEMRNRTKLSKQ